MRFRITTLDGAQGVAIHDVDALDESDAHRQVLARGLRVLEVQASRLGGPRRARLSVVSFSNELVALLEAGLSLVFQAQGQPIRDYYPTLRMLLQEADGLGRQICFLGTEPGYQFLRSLEARDLVVPVVGDVSGSHKVDR